MLLPNSTPHSSTVPTLANDRTTAVVASGRRVRPFWTALPRGARAFRTADSTVARSGAGTSGGAVQRGYIGFTPGNMLVVKFSIRAAYASSVMNARQPTLVARLVTRHRLRCEHRVAQRGL